MAVGLSVGLVYCPHSWKSVVGSSSVLLLYICRRTTVFNMIRVEIEAARCREIQVRRKTICLRLLPCHVLVSSGRVEVSKCMAGGEDSKIEISLILLGLIFALEGNVSLALVYFPSIY